MGAVLQTAGVAELAAELTCCACSSICGLATRNTATRAKFRYCSFLLLATVTCVIAMIPGLRSKLDKIPNLCTKVVSSDTCDKFVGFNAVYRIFFAMTIFHVILALLTLRVKRVNSFRARFNNGLWMFKLGLIFGLTFATFYIPKRAGFFRIWMYLSLTGGFLFVMFQIILVIDFGHSWSLTWAEKLETGNTKLWYVAMTMITVSMFTVSFGAIIAFYTYFTHPANVMKCNANFFYISYMGLQCLVAVAISVTPSVQNHLPGAGLLQSSIVVLYDLYLTWNTLSAEPDSSCNPLGNIILEYDSFTGLSGGAIFGCSLTLVLLFFACTVRTSTSHLGRYGLALAESDHYAMATLYEDKKRNGGEEVKVENAANNSSFSLVDYVGYNYSFFHIIMSLASLHILMVLTNWHSPEENSSMKTLVKNWPSVWVQMASSFACILMYIWFLVTPLVKRVWGPTFGSNFNETVIYEKNMRANFMSFNKKAAKVYQNQPIITKQPIPRDHTEDSIESQMENTRLKKGFTSVNSFVDPVPLYKQTQEKPKGFDTMSSLNSSFRFPSMRKNKKPKGIEDYASIRSSMENVQQPKKVKDYASIRSSMENVQHPKKVKDYASIRSSMENFQLNLPNKSHSRIAHVQEDILSHQLAKENLRRRNSNMLSRISTSTKTNHIYDYRNRRRARKRRNLRSGYDAPSNSSIESVNSWVSTIYKEKYKPLRYYYDSDEIIPEEEQHSPLEESACESRTRGYTKANDANLRNRQYSRDRSIYDNNIRHGPISSNLKTKPTKSRLKQFDETMKIRKSSHPSEVSRFQSSDEGEELRNFYTNPKRRKRKSFQKFRRRDIESRNRSQASFMTGRTDHNRKNPFKTTRQDPHHYKKTLTASFSLANNGDIPRSLKNSSVTKEELTESKIDEDFTGVLEKRSLGLDPMTQNDLSLEQSKQKLDAMTQMTQDISIVPSIFKHKVQDTETTTEILKLQWKILRTQAKIVKIQERIFKLQNPNNNTDAIRKIT